MRRRATIPSGPRDGAWRVSAKSCGLRRAEAFERRERLPQQPRSAPRARRVRCVFSAARGSARCSEEVSPLSSFVEFARGSAQNRRASPPLPGCGRVPRNSASSSTSMARFNAPGAPPSRHSGCFSSASSVGGSSPFAAASAASRAKIPADVSISASPPESSNARFQRPSAAITRRASARSGVTSAADLVQVPRLAHRNRDRERLHFGIGGLDHGEVCHAGREIFSATSGSASRRVPLRGRVRRPHRLGRPAPRARAAQARREFRRRVALDAEAIEQRVHRELRMVRRRAAW